MTKFILETEDQSIVLRALAAHLNTRRTFRSQIEEAIEDTASSAGREQLKVRLSDHNLATEIIEDLYQRICLIMRKDRKP